MATGGLVALDSGTSSASGPFHPLLFCAFQAGIQQPESGSFLNEKIRSPEVKTPILKALTLILDNRRRLTLHEL